MYRVAAQWHMTTVGTASQQACSVDSLFSHQQVPFCGLYKHLLLNRPQVCQIQLFTSPLSPLFGMCFISVCIPRTWHIVGAQYFSTELNCAIQTYTLYFTSQALQGTFSLQRPAPLWAVPLMCQRPCLPLPWHQHGTSSSPSHTLHPFFFLVKY